MVLCIWYMESNLYVIKLIIMLCQLFLKCYFVVVSCNNKSNAKYTENEFVFVLFIQFSRITRPNHWPSVWARQKSTSGSLCSCPLNEQIVSRMACLTLELCRRDNWIDTTNLLQIQKWSEREGNTATDYRAKIPIKYKSTQTPIEYRFWWRLYC